MYPPVFSTATVDVAGVAGVADAAVAVAFGPGRLMNKQRSADRERMMETSVNNCSAGK